MELDKNIVGLICDLEYRIGNQTYNPNSYNGWTGEEGCSFKYPVNYCVNVNALENKKLKKTKSRIEYIDVECIKTIKYTFGSNHLHIGDGIVDALEYLEERYGIDFNELEKKRTEKRIEKMQLISKLLVDGECAIISRGRWEVGVDIPKGEYVVSDVSDKSYGYLIIYVYDEQGEEINHIFSSSEEVCLKLENGYIVRLCNSTCFKKV